MGIAMRRRDDLHAIGAVGWRCDEIAVEVVVVVGSVCLLTGGSLGGLIQLVNSGTAAASTEPRKENRKLPTTKGMNQLDCRYVHATGERYLAWSKSALPRNCTKRLQPGRETTLALDREPFWLHQARSLLGLASWQDCYASWLTQINSMLACGLTFELWAEARGINMLPMIYGTQYIRLICV